MAVRLLDTAMQRDKLAQSYLFYGPEGVGKRLTALLLASALQCEEGQGIGCGRCPACQKVLRGSHPDWHLIEPDGNNIRIDQIRELQNIMSRRPHEGRRRIAVLDPAERMNDPAANALLKLLEEPPADSLIVLISAQTQKLLPTIRSRCQPIRFTPLAQDILAARLGEAYGAEQKRLLVRSAQGSMGQLLRLAEDETWDEERRQGIAWFVEEPRWGLAERLKFAEEQDAAWKERESWQQLWQLWQSLSRDRLVLALGGDAEALWNPDAFALLRGMPACGRARLELRIAQLREAQLRVQSYTSARLVAESLLLDWLQQGTSA